MTEHMIRYHAELMIEHNSFFLAHFPYYVPCLTPDASLLLGGLEEPVDALLPKRSVQLGFNVQFDASV